MPGMIRAGTSSLRAASWRGLSAALAALMGIATGALGVLARDLPPPTPIGLGDVAPFVRHEVAVAALLLGVISFAVVTAILLVHTRVRAAQTTGAARQEITALRERLDRAHALLFSESQLLICWAPAVEDPEVFGDIGVLAGQTTPRRALAFGTWLDPEQAQTMERAVEALRSRGEGFAMMLTTLSGRPIAAAGRALGGRAVLRLKDVSGTERELADLSARHADLQREVDGLRALIEALPAPIWARDEAGRIVWVNGAFAHAVEAADGADAVKRHLELLSPSARRSLLAARRAGEAYSARLPVIVAGRRRMFDVLDVPTRHGSAGIGIDVTDVETLRSELTRMVEAHRRTLDQLPTAVAIFGADQRLTFHNAAYRALWGLGADFLDSRPTDSAVLDQLRAARKLPEQADFRVWKSALHEAYRTIEAKEHLWHLPDGRTLRVVTTSNPNGGITYLFDDVTEPLNLKRRYDALARVQGETLDNLSEAVAVFASDGRLRLFNPALARLWKLSSAFLGERPHIEALINACRPLHNDEATWQLLRGAVTGLERREPITGRIERIDSTLVDCATVPLPDGATLVTFQDVTDTVNVERALRERNDALEAAYDLKNDFVHLVSYELRSPLTNIIGFAQLLEDRLTGPLTEKQREYLGYITSSSAALLAIINDILDLATIDAGVMTLDLGPVDIAATMDAAADAVRDRLNEGGLVLEIGADPQIGQFVADGRRVRQVLYNLLANAIGFSPPGETVTLAAERRDDAVLFRVTDRGPGIPIEIQDRVFDRFETHNLGSRHRGTGLGLSIVRSFVELHGGTVSLDSAVGRGTTVICVFPQVQVAERAAAE
jgi:signal transduction histidine kinase